MSKVIKFNLIVDGKSIRTLDDLRENFNVDDVYELYENGILKKWLDVRGYTKEVEAIEQLKQDTNGDILVTLSKLVRIFIHITQDNKHDYQLDSYATVLKRSNSVRMEQLRQNGFDRDEVIQQYHFSYEEFKHKLRNNVQNFSLIKSYLQEIKLNYIALFKIDYKAFYYQYIDEAPLVIFLMLADESFRDIIFENEQIKESLLFYYKDQSTFEKIGPHLREFKGTTEGMWKYLGDQDKRYMAIYLTPGSCSVGTQKDQTRDYSANEVNGNYMTFDGLLFKSASNTSTLRLIYMEV